MKKQANEKRKERAKLKDKDPNNYKDKRNKERRKERANKLNTRDSRLREFRAKVRDGFKFSCVCCMRRKFNKGVIEYNKELISDLQKKVVTDGNGIKKNVF